MDVEKEARSLAGRKRAWVVCYWSTCLAAAIALVNLLGLEVPYTGTLLSIVLLGGLGIIAPLAYMWGKNDSVLIDEELRRIKEWQNENAALYRKRATEAEHAAAQAHELRRRFR